MSVSLADLVRNWRTRRGWSQEALADAAGVSSSLVTHVETGRRGLSHGSAEALANALELTGKEREALHAARSARHTPVAAAEAAAMKARLAEVRERMRELLVRETGGDELGSDDEALLMEYVAQEVDLMDRATKAEWAARGDRPPPGPPVRGAMGDPLIEALAVDDYLTQDDLRIVYELAFHLRKLRYSEMRREGYAAGQSSFALAAEGADPEAQEVLRRARTPSPPPED